MSFKAGAKDVMCNYAQSEMQNGQVERVSITSAIVAN